MKARVGTGRRGWSWAAALVAIAAAGCGLRSDGLLPDEAGDDLLSTQTGSGDSGITDPDRPGSCNDRLPLVFGDTTVSGELPAHGSLSEAWCGSDGGPEDAYVLVADFNTDVTLTLDRADFNAVLRVTEGGCGTGEGTTLVCDREIDDRPFHFLAEGGKEYTVTIDSAEGDAGSYQFSTVYGWPPLEACPVHPETIDQVNGATFIWENTFSQGQGQVDGLCGGPGRENMFRLNAVQAGNMYVQVEGTNGFVPVASVRTSCAAVSELACSRDGDTGIPGVAELSFFIEGPGEYFIVVDQGEIGAGDYKLRVEFF